MLYNLIMTIVLVNGDYESNLIDTNLTKEQCNVRTVLLDKIVKEELEVDKRNNVDNQISVVRVFCTEIKQTNTYKYKTI